MAEERPKPTAEQREWLKTATQELITLKKVVEMSRSRKDFFNLTITQIDHQKYDDWAKAKHDKHTLEVARDEEILLGQKAIIRLETWERLIGLSGICSQCRGSGYYRINFGQRNMPLNEPTPTCNKCWGSGWENAPSPSPFENLKLEDFGLKAEEKK